MTTLALVKTLTRFETLIIRFLLPIDPQKKSGPNDSPKLSPIAQNRLSDTKPGLSNAEISSGGERYELIEAGMVGRSIEDRFSLLIDSGTSRLSDSVSVPLR